MMKPGAVLNPPVQATVLPVTPPPQHAKHRPITFQGEQFDPPEKLLESPVFLKSLQEYVEIVESISRFANEAHKADPSVPISEIQKRLCIFTDMFICNNSGLPKDKYISNVPKIYGEVKDLFRSLERSLRNENIPMQTRVGAVKELAFPEVASPNIGFIAMLRKAEEVCQPGVKKSTAEQLAKRLGTLPQPAPSEPKGEVKRPEKYAAEQPAMQPGTLPPLSSRPSLLKDPKDYTPEDLADSNGPTAEQLQNLINDGLNIDVTEERTGQTALMIAVQRRDFERVRVLFNAGADPDLQARNGRSALGFALNNRGNHDIAKFLMSEMRPGPKATREPLHVRLGNTKSQERIQKLLAPPDGPTVQELNVAIRQGLNINKPSFLAIAARAGYLDSVKALLKAGANPNASVGLGFTPLMNAVVNGNEDIIRFVIVYGADIDAANDNGDTALSLATYKRDDPDADPATREKYTKVVDILMKAKAQGK